MKNTYIKLFENFKDEDKILSSLRMKHKMSLLKSEQSTIESEKQYYKGRAEGIELAIMLLQ